MATLTQCVIPGFFFFFYPYTASLPHTHTPIERVPCSTSLKLGSAGEANTMPAVLHLLGLRLARVLAVAGARTKI